eukprot:tig00020816_g14201.t1
MRQALLALQTTNPREPHVPILHPRAIAEMEPWSGEVPRGFYRSFVGWIQRRETSTKALELRDWGQHVHSAEAAQDAVLAAEQRHRKEFYSLTTATGQVKVFDLPMFNGTAAARRLAPSPFGPIAVADGVLSYANPALFEPSDILY